MAKAVKKEKTPIAKIVEILELEDLRIRVEYPSVEEAVAIAISQLISARNLLDFEIKRLERSIGR